MQVDKIHHYKTYIQLQYFIGQNETEFYPAPLPISIIVPQFLTNYHHHHSHPNLLAWPIPSATAATRSCFNHRNRVMTVPMEKAAAVIHVTSPKASASGAASVSSPRHKHIIFDIPLHRMHIIYIMQMFSLATW